MLFGQLLPDWLPTNYYPQKKAQKVVASFHAPFGHFIQQITYCSSFSSSHLVAISLTAPSSNSLPLSTSFSGLIHNSRRNFPRSLVAEATAHCVIFTFHSYFDVACPLSSSGVSCTRFRQVCNFFIRHSFVLWQISFRENSIRLLNFENLVHILTFVAVLQLNFALVVRIVSASKRWVW